MAEPHFANDDDLPRTLRRERDAREREAREREAQLAAQAGHHAYAAPPPGYAHQEHGLVDPMPAYGGPILSGTVTRLEIPFRHLVWFFLKAVIAAIPALILLTLLLFAGGQALKAFLPGFRHFEIVVRSPDALVPPVKPAEPAAPAPAKAGTPTKR